RMWQIRYRESPAPAATTCSSHPRRSGRATTRAGSAEQRGDPRRGAGRGGRRCAHVRRDLGQRRGLEATPFAVPVVLGLDEIGQVGTREEDAMTVGTLVDAQPLELTFQHRGATLGAVEFFLHA